MTRASEDPRPLIVSLADADPKNVAFVGGKAANLGAACRAGFTVPPGFVITTAAFDAVLQAVVDGETLRDRIEGALARCRDVGVGSEAARAAEHVATEVRALLDRVPLPRGVVDAIGAAYRTLGPIVAVRSSAPSEDACNRSLAGHFDTFLDVEGEGPLVHAIRRTLASFASARAIISGLRNDGKPPVPAMAIVVQRMVVSTYSGILFTRDPLGDDDGMVLEVVAGRGASLADGTVTPERLRLDRDGGHPERLSSGDFDLPADCLHLLADLGRHAEAAFGGPQDIEWAICEGRVHLLQSRPITTIASTAWAAHHGSGGDFWTAANSQEALEDPVTPLTYTFFRPLIEAGRRDVFRSLGVGDPRGEYMRLYHGRVYFNTDYFRRFLETLPGIPTEIFDRLLFGEGLSGATVTFPIPRPSRVLVTVVSVVMRMWVTAERRFRLFLRRFEETMAAMRRTDLAAQGDARLLVFLGEITRPLEEALRLHVLGTAMSGGSYLLLAKFLRASHAALDENAIDELLAVVSGVETAEVSEALFALALLAEEHRVVGDTLLAEPPAAALARLRADTRDDATTFIAALDRFADRYGHLAEKQAELLAPRWRDDLAAVITIVATYVRARRDGRHLIDPRVAKRSCRERKRRVRAAVEAALRAGRPRLLAWRVPVFRHLLSAAERYAPYRENLRFHALRVLEQVRNVLREVGRRLVLRNLLDDRDDIFFLEIDELRRWVCSTEGDGASIRAKVIDRRGAHEKALRLDPPKFVHDDGTPAAPPLALHRAGRMHTYLEGVGVSGGIVSGRVRRAETLSDALAIAEDELLVARAATPAWTPAFFLARGVILDIGGMLSHCAVIAREYGIPCVVGVRSGMELLRDGDHVTLDAHAGRVYMLDARSSAKP